MPVTLARLGRTAIVVSSLASLMPGCGAAHGPRLSESARTRAALEFELVAVDGRSLSSASLAGRVSVLVFITTYDLGSQAVLRELMDVSRKHAPRINVGIVALEPPHDEPLVRAFADTLELPFPIALADAETLARRGPFGVVDRVPTVVYLDAQGTESSRTAGLTTGEAMERAIRDAERGASSR